MALAALIVLLYLGVKLWLLTIVDDNIADREWGRYTYLAGGLDSVVAVAIGWLFGREVHRKAFDAASESATHARQLEKQARDSETEARQAHLALSADHIAAVQRADRGEGLARAMRAIVSETRDGARVDTAALGGASETRNATLEHTVASAERLIADFFSADSESA